jgi:hypothetical protein
MKSQASWVNKLPPAKHVWLRQAVALRQLQPGRRLKPGGVMCQPLPALHAKLPWGALISQGVKCLRLKH